MKYLPILFAMTLMLAVCFIPELGFCSVESTLGALQSRLTTTILPLVSILGLIIAGLSFVAGSPNARAHLWLAIFGMIIGFGATSIMNFIKGVVQ